MVNTTETFWSVDGVSLQTYAFNIVTLGGDRMSPPPLRGDDITVPFRAGQVWRPKVPDSRTITLGMWVIGADENGNIPQNEDSRRTFDRNWRKIRRLLWNSRRQITLTKRFWVPVDDLEDAGVPLTGLTTEGGWALISATAKAEFAGGLEPTMGGPSRAAFTVDLRLADPYFYGDEIAIPLSMSTSDSLPGPSATRLILGDDRTTSITLDLEGPLEVGQISNLTATPSLWLRYLQYVEDGETAQIRVSPFTATHYDGGVSYPSAGSIRHAGDRMWLYLDPETTTLKLTAQSGTGKAWVRYRPVWF